MCCKLKIYGNYLNSLAPLIAFFTLWMLFFLVALTEQSPRLNAEFVQPIEVNQTSMTLQDGAKKLLDFHAKNKNNMNGQDSTRLLVASAVLIELSKTDDAIKTAQALEAFTKELK